MTKTAETLLALLRGAVTGAHDPVDLTGVDLSALFEFAKLHDVAPIVCDELSRLGALGESEAARKFQKQQKLALFRHLQRGRTIAQTRQALASAHIPFVLLKGAVLMGLYPEPWMRTCTDVDVLVPEDAYASAAAALKAAGFSPYATTPHDATFRSPEQYPVELHFQLVEDDRLTGASDVLTRVWDYTDPADAVSPADAADDPPATGEHPVTGERRMRDEFFYLYHLAHMAKHFQSGGGCGIRSLVDLWLLRHTVPFDADKRESLVRASGIAAFARAAEALSDKWFSGLDAPNLSEFEDYVLGGGLYGTLRRAAMVRKSKNGNPVRYYAGRLFLPYRTMRDAYPILQTHPALLPACWVARWGKLLTPAGRRRAAREIQVTQTMDPAERARIESLMKQLELW